MKQLLLDSEIGRQLTAEQKSEIFHSEPFRSMLKNGLQKQWTLSPQDLGLTVDGGRRELKDASNMIMDEIKKIREHDLSEYKKS